MRSVGMEEVVRGDTAHITSRVIITAIARYRIIHCLPLSVIEHIEPFGRRFPWEAATRLAPDSASAHYLKAQTLQHLGRSSEARDEFAASARLRKSNRDRLEEEVSGHPGLDAQIGISQ